VVILSNHFLAGSLGGADALIGGDPGGFEVLVATKQLGRTRSAWLDGIPSGCGVGANQFALKRIVKHNQRQSIR
jgi:hypothetical protein